MMYSKSQLLAMILDNEQKSTVLETASPLITASEVVNGAFAANFVVNARATDSVRGLALGGANDGPEAQSAMFARATSRNSVQYLPEDSTFPANNTKSTKMGTFLNDTLDSKNRNHGMLKNKTLDPGSTNQSFAHSPFGGAQSPINRKKLRQTNSILKMSMSGSHIGDQSPNQSNMGFQIAAAHQGDSFSKLDSGLTTVQSKVSVAEKFQIENSPWTAAKTKGVKFEDYKARMQASHDRGKETAAQEKTRLGDFNKEKSEI